MSQNLPEAENQGSASGGREEGTARHQEPFSACLLGVGGSEFGPTDSNSEKTKKKSKYKKRLEWLRRNKPAIEALGFFVLIAYTSATFWEGCETMRAADAARKAARVASYTAGIAADQFAMDERRAEDAEEAILAVNSTPTVGDRFLPFGITNSGKATARDVNGSLDISLTRLPSGRLLRVLERFKVSLTELRPTLPGRPYSYSHLFSLHIGDDWRALDATKEALVLSASLQYENGFGHLQRVRVCTDWVFYPTPENAPLNPISGAGFDCDDLGRWLRDRAHYLALMKKAH